MFVRNSGVQCEHIDLADDLKKLGETHTHLSQHNTIMTVPDSHTQIFTRIPEAIDKTWSTYTKRCVASGAMAEPSDKHAGSLIKSIGLRVEFDSQLVSTPDTFDESDDIESEMIRGWQDVRRSWALIERAVASAVLELSRDQVRRAEEQGMKTIDILGRVQTRPTYAPTESPAVRPILRQAGAPSNLGSTLTTRRVQTIHPNESASTTQPGVDDLRSLLERFGVSQSSRSKRARSQSRRRKRG